MRKKNTTVKPQSILDLEKKLVTYPRTDSQYLSDDMEGNAKSVIEAVKSTLFNGLNVGLSPVDGSGETKPDISKVLNSKKVTDHHAIIPTIEITKATIPELPDGERKILYLAANRLLCATADKHRYNSVKAEIIVNNTRFKASGKTVLDKGWKYYEEALKQMLSVKTDLEDSDDDGAEKSLPELGQGKVLSGIQVKVTDHFTQPKSRYTEDLLLSAMERAGSSEMNDGVERKGLGTPATRADIIEKLVKKRKSEERRALQ